MKTIRRRILTSYGVLIASTVVTIEILLCLGVRHYYYTQLEAMLKQQANVAASVFANYLYEGSLHQRSTELIYNIPFVLSQIQVLDNHGKVVEDSAGLTLGGSEHSPDIAQALASRPGVYMGAAEYTKDRIMAVSRPILAGTSVRGAVRVISSLTPTEQTLSRIYLLFGSVGAGLLTAVLAASMLLSRTITAPLADVTAVAETMARGQLSVRAQKRYEDEVGRLADTLNHMAEEISRHDKLKNEFISSISHELRTPLTSIKGWTVTLRTGPLDKQNEIREGLDIIETETDRLTGLVEELLDFSRLSAHRVNLSLVPFVLHGLLSDVARQMTPRAGRLGISLTLEIDESKENIELVADRDRLKQVLINLVDNALKWTERGGTIALGARRIDETVCISVQDTGCGIAPEEVLLVTEKFYKGSDTGVKGGSGLGLAICEELVRLHGGRLEIESALQAGTTVTIYLPLTKEGE
ncbi:HAMP domain-containing sensor histidine kinase [Aneurinibacillus sp. Ricciae_BoGa-3]|uniref:sensor histidine kinase n=1 Tax=Aneurinibacillus sp. Ricciae_BoGa-3 TaxID=3022697 RepID=UPI0023426D88|nr:HAMP domain-containing sensor histidine kinase [Aneurinibacillus sp. Ricciae_BoGa-3]WCK55185.1 HAMP domain-containing sensor histidine kinase [Aneurinibacillus sp. Ricciae_BoGa-3]